MPDFPHFDFSLYEPPELPELPELQFVDLTVAQIKAMPDSELLSILSGESEHQGIITLPLQQLITSELLARTLANTSKPHWSVVPSFWLLVAATILALIAAVAAVLALPQLSASTRPLPSQLAPVAAPAENPQRYLIFPPFEAHQAVVRSGQVPMISFRPSMMWASSSGSTTPIFLPMRSVESVRI